MHRGVAAGLLSALMALIASPAQTALAVDPVAVGPAIAGQPVLAATVGPMIFISQTLNNCGPASVAEVLDFWGIHKSQGEVQAVLRADGNPGGMAPFGMPAYLRAL